jgi:succinyl-CoA synthetase beta subunit
MRKHGITVQKGEVASTPAEALTIAKRLVAGGAKELVIKAQIHAGGRGKGHFDTGFKGGVKVCSRPEDVERYAKEMLGHTLFTHQTGEKGQRVAKVLVHESIDFDRELYFAILLDRAHNGPVIVASQQGGMDIEEVAAKSPQAIFTRPVDIVRGITEEDTRAVAEALGFSPQKAPLAQEQMKRLYALFIEEEATQVEINPFVETKAGDIYCVDAKILFDDSAAFRHAALHALRDRSMEDSREVEASAHNLNYIGLEGNIGCMVNGAGLAMATMDIIKLHGGAPANFLDVGGGASEKQVEEAFRILSQDSSVKAILVNIFGGIMRCDVIANGIVAAARSVQLRIPLIVRLEGTNVEKGNEILKQSGIKLVTANDLDQAAEKAVNALKQQQTA